MHLAINKSTGEKVAIKIISKAKFHTVSGLQQFVQNEKNILFNSPVISENIVKLYQILETPDTFYHIYEYCNGGSFLDRILESGKIPEKRAVRYFR